MVNTLVTNNSQTAGNLEGLHHTKVVDIVDVQVTYFESPEKIPRTCTNDKNDSDLILGLSISFESCKKNYELDFKIRFNIQCNHF